MTLVATGAYPRTPVCVDSGVHACMLPGSCVYACHVYVGVCMCMWVCAYLGICPHPSLLHARSIRMPLLQYVASSHWEPCTHSNMHRMIPPTEHPQSASFSSNALFLPAFQHACNPCVCLTCVCPFHMPMCGAAACRAAMLTLLKGDTRLQVSTDPWVTAPHDPSGSRLWRTHIARALRVSIEAFAHALACTYTASSNKLTWLTPCDALTGNCRQTAQRDMRSCAQPCMPCCAYLKIQFNRSYCLILLEYSSGG